MGSNNQSGVKLLVGTTKGAFVLSSDSARQKWDVSQPNYLGNVIQHFIADPRNPDDWLIAGRTGHLGPTVFRSHDRGATWKEATRPPAFPKAPEGEKGKAVKMVFWLTPSNAKEPGVWYAGSSPMGLWRSEDRGDTWSPVEGFNNHPRQTEWTMPDGPPDIGQALHSILVDPRDANHLYFGVSVGGVFESTDRGQTWTPFNKGVAADFMPEPDPEWGHDPHCLVMHPTMPDRIYQQNHCGIYRIDRPAERWDRIGDNMPKEIGDIGFAISTHPHNPDTCWVFPMDGQSVWPRTTLEGRPAIYKSTDAGKSWKRCDKGWPKENAWLTVKRQCMAHDHASPLGLYVGTTSGEIWGSTDEGDSWRQIAAHLPQVYSVEVAP